MEPNGTLLAYQRILRSLEALLAIDRPAGVNISDVGGAYNRIHRSSLIDRIIRYVAQAIRLFQVLYRIPYR